VEAAGGGSGKPKAAPKKKKADTKAVSLQMFNEGKSVNDIAAERELTARTIENHLAYWVEQGEIEVTRLVAEEALAEITAAFTALETTYLKPVYEWFAEKYDYATLKFAAAYLQQESN